VNTTIPRSSSDLAATTVPSTSTITTPAKANPRPSGISSSKPQQPSSTQLPGMGPMITPTRQVPSKSGSSGIRNSSGGKVWTHPTPEPAVSSSLAASVMSFVAIQYSQQEQLTSPAKDKLSLREIQEEEQALEAEVSDGGRLKKNMYRKKLWLSLSSKENSITTSSLIGNLDIKKRSPGNRHRWRRN